MNEVGWRQSHLDVAIRVDQDVVRLQVTVEDAGTVEGAKAE